jgi:hypothetical protein
MAHIPGQPELTLQHTDGSLLDEASMTNGVMPALGQNLNGNDPFAVFDIGLHQYWTDGDLDLFSNLVGVEDGLTSLMAG